MKKPTAIVSRTLIQSIEIIGAISEEINGNVDAIREKDPDFQAVCDFFDLSPAQAMLFSVIFILNFKNRSVDVADLSEFMKTTTLKLLPLIPEIEVLEQKRLIVRYSNSHRSDLKRQSVFDIGYFITRNVLNAILKNDRSSLGRKKRLSMIALLEEVATLVEDRDDGNITYDELTTETETILQNNPDMDFVRQIQGLDLLIDEAILLLFVCHETINGSETVDLTRTCEKVYEDVDKRFRMRQRLISGRSILIQKDMLKLHDGYFRSDREVLLTEKAIDMLFAQDKVLLHKKDKTRKELVAVDNLKKVRLFFNREELEQLQFVTRSLKQTNYLKTVRRLEKQNMASGFAILFHGAPGTGKTASVYDIARKTGRDVFMVDISSTKSMWFGESEKVVKELFDRYRRLAETMEKAPILLFNECDGVFSIRKDVNHSSVAQTENAIQNIILQEMETLKGILIATTNLTKNLDPAFERRFLFKVGFNKPAKEVIQKILLDKIPWMKPEEAVQIACRHELSGGNIENIARKAQMHSVLYGIEPGMEKIVEFCREESMPGKERKAVGFRS